MRRKYPNRKNKNISAHLKQQMPVIHKWYRRIIASLRDLSVNQSLFICTKLLPTPWIHRQWRWRRHAPHTESRCCPCTVQQDVQVRQEIHAHRRRYGDLSSRISLAGGARPDRNWRTILRWFPYHQPTHPHSCPLPSGHDYNDQMMITWWLKVVHNLPKDRHMNNFRYRSNTHIGTHA